MGAGYVSTPLSSFGGWLLASNAPTARDLRTARVPIGHPSRVRSRIVAQVPARTSAPSRGPKWAGDPLSLILLPRQTELPEGEIRCSHPRKDGRNPPTPAHLPPPQGQNHLQGGRRPYHLSPSEQRGPPDIPACDSGM